MNIFDISVLEKALSDVVKASDATATIYNDRPKAAPTKADFAIVKLSGDIIDMACYGLCTMEISLFAKDVNNLKNGVKLGIMQKKLMESIPAEKKVMDDTEVLGVYLFSQTPTVVADAPDDYGYHARVITLQTIIKSI